MGILSKIGGALGGGLLGGGGSPFGMLGGSMGGGSPLGMMGGSMGGGGNSLLDMFQNSDDDQKNALMQMLFNSKMPGAIGGLGPYANFLNPGG